MCVSEACESGGDAACVSSESCASAYGYSAYGVKFANSVVK